MLRRYKTPVPYVLLACLEFKIESQLLLGWTMDELEVLHLGTVHLSLLLCIVHQSVWGLHICVKDTLISVSITRFLTHRALRLSAVNRSLLFSVVICLWFDIETPNAQLVLVFWTEASRAA
jgi:hypothetical protein